MSYSHTLKDSDTLRAMRKSKVLTNRQQIAADATLDGKSTTEAAELAGYARSDVAGAALEARNVKEYLDEKRSELSDALQIGRGECIVGFMEAIDFAKKMADPATMIRGWTEVGKMLGHYAPEVKQINITAGQAVIRSKFEQMPDEELLRLAEEHAIIEGEFSDVSRQH